MVRARETLRSKRINDRIVDQLRGAVQGGIPWRPDPPAFFFLYLNIDVPIGGPPFLFVTGIAGGFGINSRLVLPSIDEVANYPLLPGKAGRVDQSWVCISPV